MTERKRTIKSVLANAPQVIIDLVNTARVFALKTIVTKDGDAVADGTKFDKSLHKYVVTYHTEPKGNGDKVDSAVLVDRAVYVNRAKVDDETYKLICEWNFSRFLVDMPCVIKDKDSGTEKESVSRGRLFNLLKATKAVENALLNPTVKINPAQAKGIINFSATLHHETQKAVAECLRRSQNIAKPKERRPEMPLINPVDYAPASE